MADSPNQLHDPVSGLTYRLRERRDPQARDILLFHGLTGDEDVMWILETGLPEGGMVASPRAPFEHDRGFSWVERPEGGPKELKGFDAGAEKVEVWIDSLHGEHGLDPASSIYVGFSQGAALAFALAERGRVRPAAVVALAGFLPAGVYQSLSGLPVFWGHGTQDETIPLERAYEDIERLRSLDVQVHPCEANVGHKVGVECMRGLKRWLERSLGAQGD